MDLSGSELRTSRSAKKVADSRCGGVRFSQGALSRNAMDERLKKRDATGIRNDDSLGRRRAEGCFEQSLPLLSEGGLDESEL